MRAIINPIAPEKQGKGARTFQNLMFNERME